MDLKSGKLLSSLSICIYIERIKIIFYFSFSTKIKGEKENKNKGKFNKTSIWRIEISERKRKHRGRNNQRNNSVNFPKSEYSNRRANSMEINNSKT